MANYNDLFEQEVNGTKSRGLYLRDSASFDIIQSRLIQSRINGSLDIVDPRIDELWGGYVPTGAPHNYFDYYFSGQDIRAYVDGTADDPDFSTLPIVQLGFNISQKKEAVYGFWSYTYDAVMRGTRIVSGQVTFATKAPDYMRRLLSKSAQARAMNASGVYYQGYRSMTEEDANIERYWGRNIDPSIAAQGKQVFSVHPPFSMIILYGVQNISMNPSTYNNDRFEIWDKYNKDNPLSQDVNERLVESDPQDQVSRLILEAIELTDFSTGYGPDGSVVTETYNFFARDIIIPSRPSGVATNGNPLVDYSNIPNIPVTM